ncbi:ankyrin repeat-containing domain protein [Annulohypoxylon stygium]|nr:ankyrin repeat-containing domain protein [Annulohypoxylon stygium]
MSFAVDHYATRTFMGLDVCHSIQEFNELINCSYMSPFPGLAQIIQARAKNDILSGKDQIINPSPLVAAVIKTPELVNVLLNAEVDANESPGFVHPGFNYRYRLLPSRTPLQAAIETGNMTVISQLLGSGADINALPGCTRGATCLQIAAINGHIGIARMLLDRGAITNAPRARVEGRTAIEGAAEMGRLDMIKLLLSHLKDSHDLQKYRVQFIRAIKHATREGHGVVANMLKSYVQWNEDDEDLYKRVDLRKRVVIDGMTQELSHFESSSVDWRESKDWHFMFDKDDSWYEREDEYNTSKYDSDDEPYDNWSKGKSRQEPAVDYEIPDNKHVDPESTSISLELTLRSRVDEMNIEPRLPVWVSALGDPNQFMGYGSENEER